MKERDYSKISTERLKEMQEKKESRELHLEILIAPVQNALHDIYDELKKRGEIGDA